MASRESIQQDDFLDNPSFEAICEQMQSATTDILIEDGDQESQDKWTTHFEASEQETRDLVLVSKTPRTQQKIQRMYKLWNAVLKITKCRYVFPLYGGDFFYTNKALALPPQMAHQGIKSLCL